MRGKENRAKSIGSSSRLLKLSVYRDLPEIRSMRRDLMAEMTIVKPSQQMRPSALAAVLGLFAGLCAFFAACAILLDWYGEAAQARWPVASAVVERTDVIGSARATKDGGGTEW